MNPDERVARWRVTRDPQELWPETDGAARARAYHDIWGATARLLDGQPAELETAGDHARALGVAAGISGMGPLLGWWIERGLLTAAPAVRDLLALHLAHGRQRSTRLAAELDRILRTLEAHEVRPTLLKGAYTALRYFEEPGLRPSSDIDLLVPGGEWARAGIALTGLGFRRHSMHTLPHREEWAPESGAAVQSLELVHADNPWTVDLHASLDRSYFRGLAAGLGTPGPSALEPWPRSGVTLPVLRQPWLAAHLALSAAADLPDIQLMRVVELIMVIREDTRNGRLAWPALRRLLGETGTARFAFPAFELAARLVPGTVPDDVRQALRDGATKRLRLAVDHAAVTVPGHTPPSLRTSLAWTRGPFQVARRVIGLLYPSGPGITGGLRWRIARRRLGLLARRHRA